MKKKIIKNILFTLLFTLLLGCFTNAYATSFTETELKNIIYNTLTNFGSNYVTEVKNMCDNIDLSTVASKTQEYDYVYIICPIGKVINETSNYYMEIYYSNYLGVSKPTPTSCFGLERVDINFKNFNPDFDWYTYQRETRITQNGWDVSSWRFNDQDLYQYGDGTGNMLLASGWHPSNIDEGVFNSIIWKLDTRNDNLYKIYPNSKQNYHLISSAMAVELGTLTNSQYADTISYQFIGYNSNSGQFNYQYPVKYIFRYKYNGQIFNYLNGVTTNNNGVYSTRLLVDTQNYGNCILILTIKPDNTDLQTITEYYYIDTNKTYTANGWIYPTNTFSGDYNNQYNQQQNTNNIIGAVDQITQTEDERDQWWRNAFNDLFTLKSGDAQNMINDFMQNTQLNDYGDYAIQEGILRTLEGTPQDFKISWRKYSNANTTEQTTK